MSYKVLFGNKFISATIIILFNVYIDIINRFSNLYLYLLFVVYIGVSKCSNFKLILIPTIKGVKYEFISANMGGNNITPYVEFYYYFNINNIDMLRHYLTENNIYSKKENLILIYKKSNKILEKIINIEKREDYSMSQNTEIDFGELDFSNARICLSL